MQQPDNRWHPLAKMIVHVMREEIRSLIEEMLKAKIEKRYLSVKDLHEYFGISEVGIYRLVEKRKIPFFRRGRRVMFDRILIDAWCRENAK